MLSLSCTSVQYIENMGPLLVIALLVFSKRGEKGKTVFFLFFSFYTPDRRSIKPAYFCWSRGFFALIRLLRELPASWATGFTSAGNPALTWHDFPPVMTYIYYTCVLGNHVSSHELQIFTFWPLSAPSSDCGASKIAKIQIRQRWSLRVPYLDYDNFALNLKI
jgi:hypothetical protein